jgi:hypothetical protein
MKKSIGGLLVIFLLPFPAAATADKEDTDSPLERDRKQGVNK